MKRLALICGLLALLWSTAAFAVPGASLVVSPTNPTGTASSTALMMGFGVQGTPTIITPQTTGKILITISGSVGNALATATTTVYIFTGTGAPPVNGVVGPGGSAVRTSLPISRVVCNSCYVPFSSTYLVTNAVVGVPLWIDLALRSDGTNVASVINPVVTAVEVPGAVLSVSPTNPTGTTSAPGVMMGYGVQGTPTIITPQSTGKILITMNGAVSNAVSTTASSVYLHTGTGAPPANGAASTGAQNTNQGATRFVCNSCYIPYSTTFLVTGTVGVPLWIDAKLRSDGVSLATVVSNVVSAVELQ